MKNTVTSDNSSSGRSPSGGGLRSIVCNYAVPAVAAVALIYAMFAGLRTVGDPDLGWCLATARWIVQHHSIPSTDVLSYTARGKEWIYPVLSQLLFYGVYCLGGYSFLSLLGMAVCVGTVVLLVRRGNAVTVVLAALAVPIIADRIGPRAEMFTAVLFAGFVSLLWHYHRSGQGPLWVLPILMLLWVNLHLGFIAGLGMCAAYVFLELGDAAMKERRVAALASLRRAVPWLAATGLATFLNPWGARIYLAIARQNDINRIHSRWIADWLPIRLTPAALSQALLWRDPDIDILWIMAVGIVAAFLALWLRRLASAALLGTAIYLAIHANRFQGPFVPIAVIIGGGTTADALREIGWLRQIWQRVPMAVIVAVLVAVTSLVGVRVSDLVTNRYYLGKNRPFVVFGPGESPLFPERATAFLLRERLPSNIFNDFNSGGFISWALSPVYADYIDGRSVPFGAELMLNSEKLMRTSLDSSMWQEEAEKRNINTIIVSLDHVLSSGAALSSLETSCRSQRWRPVYIDTEAGVFVRVQPDTKSLVDRLHVDCDTLRFDSPPSGSGIRGRAEQFEYFVNAASILIVIDRNADAMEALERAENIFLYSPFLHYLKGVALRNTGRWDEAEREFRTAIELGSDDAPLSLARYYNQQGRYAEEASALSHAAELSRSPHWIYVKLGYAQLAMGVPEKALTSFDEAEKESPFVYEAAADGAEFRASIAEGRAEARRLLHAK